MPTANKSIAKSGGGRKINQPQIATVLHPSLTEFCSVFIFNLCFYHFTQRQFQAGQATNIPPSAILGRYLQFFVIVYELTLASIGKEKLLSQLPKNLSIVQL